jgi:hypothetical protein
MASIRSISTTKPPDPLSIRRSDRSSTPAIPVAQRKLTLSKTTSNVVSSSRQKSARMSLKKDALGSMTSPSGLDSCDTDTPTDNLNLTTDQMASIKLQDLPPSRSRSRISDIANNSIPQVNHIEDQENDKKELSSSSSPKSSISNNQYTLESFETIRTVGTGKNVIK